MCGACCVNQGPCVRNRGGTAPRRVRGRRGRLVRVPGGAAHSPGPTGASAGSPPQEHRRATAGRSIGARRPEIRTHHHKNSSTRHQHPATRRPPKGRGHEQRPRARGGFASSTNAGARCRHREGVVDDTARGLLAPRGGCRHCEGVVDIVRGLSTPRGGYNARRCQQRASVRTTRAHANNARRCSSARQRAAPIAPISAGSGSHTRDGIRKHSAAHKGGIKPLCAAHVA